MSTSSSQSSSTLDGLPKQFVTAMRTLFDIMDDKRVGCVNVADIEARWQDDGSKGLPKGVIESLRKVTPPNGQLSFERFCAGLKICLLRNQVETQRGSGGNNRVNGTPPDSLTLNPPTSTTNNRPPSAPLLSLSPPPPPPPPLATVPLLLSTALPSLHHHQHQQRSGLGDNDRIINNNNSDNTTGMKNHLNLVHHGNPPPGMGKIGGGWHGGTAVNTAAIRPNVVSTQRTLTSLLKDNNTNPPSINPSQTCQQIIPSDNNTSHHIQHHHRKSSYDSLNSKLIPMTKPPPTSQQQPPPQQQQQQQLMHGNQNTVPGGGILYGPPKPPRAMDRVNNGGNHVGANVAGNHGFDREGIRTALQNWQIGVMVNNNERDQVDLKHLNSPDKPTQAQQQQPLAIQPYSGLLRTTTSRSLGDGSATNQHQHISDINSAINNLNHLNLSPNGPSTLNNNSNNNSSSSGQGIYQKKNNVRRREPRRHTLQNGIDYNMLKRMKQIEQEKEVLIVGLTAIEKARDWYMKQIAATQDKMKYLGRMGHVEQWSEAQQERLELQRARVMEVNRHLAALTDSWERGGLPLHMNLAVQHLQQPVHPLDCANRLKQQNRRLTEEVGKKTDRISILEREKQSLIRELLQTRVPNRSSQEEAVF